jgi:uncharacterized protein
MIGKRTGPGDFVSRASVRGGWVKDQRDHRQPAHNRRPGRDPQFKTGNKSVIIAARGACFLEDLSYPKLSTLESCLWPMLVPLEIPEVVPVATSPPGTTQGYGGNAMSDAPAESGAGVRVTCDVARGVVEVHDPRLLRYGRETFCLALVKHAVATSGACRAAICLRSSVCRFEFTPGSRDLVELAEGAASAIRAAARDASGPIVSERKQPAAWVSITAFAAGARESLWETLIEEPGRVWLSHAALREAPWLAVRVARVLRGLPGVAACRANPWFGRVEIDIDSVLITVADLATVAETTCCQESGAVDAAATAPPEGPADSEEGTPAETRHRRRLVDLLLAGGTFTVAVAGVIVPGVPTAPFLLLSHHYLHRGAPETLGRLCHLPGVGWMIRKADRAERSLSDGRALWKSLTWSALAAAVFLVVHPPLPVALAIEFGLTAFSGLHA